MRHAGPPVEILVINGFDDDHLRTDERLRLARLANPVEIATGPANGLRRLMELRDDHRLPGLVVIDLDLDEADQVLDGIRRASDLIDLPVIVLDDGSVQLDVRAGSTTVRVPRPAVFSDLMGATNDFGRFRFDVEMRELPMRYEAWMWLRYAEVTVDLAEADAADGAISVT